jgi:hypothetical protein
LFFNFKREVIHMVLFDGPWIIGLSGGLASFGALAAFLLSLPAVLGPVLLGAAIPLPMYGYPAPMTVLGALPAILLVCCDEYPG